MIPVATCLVCGGTGLAKVRAELAPFLQQRCRIAPVPPLERAWCGACDFLFYDHRLDEAEVLRLYRSYRDPDYIRERLAFEPDYAMRHQDFLDHEDEIHRSRIQALRADLAPHVDPDAPLRVLDYGGEADLWLGRGALPRAEVAGFDLREAAVQPSEGAFDLVLCAHVLEHVSFPGPFLAGLAGYARPGGLLYLEVPAEAHAGPGEAVLGAQRNTMHEHVSLFSLKALDRLVRGAGLEVLMLDFRNGLAMMIAGKPLIGPWGDRALTPFALSERMRPIPKPPLHGRVEPGHGV